MICIFIYYIYVICFLHTCLHIHLYLLNSESRKTQTTDPSYLQQLYKKCILSFIDISPVMIISTDIDTIVLGA